MPIVGKSIKVVLHSGKVMLINNIDEFVSGYYYLYVRHIDGTTVSYSRNIIKEVFKILPNGKEMDVLLKKPK